MRLLATVSTAAGLLCATSIAQAQQPAPARHVGKWLLNERGQACAARLVGDQADTLLMLNKAGALVLAAGHGDWTGLKGQAPISLSIDGAIPEALNATMMNEIVLTLVTDPDMVERLRRAHSLSWDLPSGHYTAKVSDLGKALDAISACRGSQPGPPLDQ